MNIIHDHLIFKYIEVHLVWDFDGFFVKLVKSLFFSVSFIHFINKFPRGYVAI